MPEREFELYLSLLSRFLRLEAAQRDEIADELRDHLDQRLEELAARGISREEAIHKALEEFGDAAELAKHFTQATHIRRRRLIMRCTYGTVAALAAALLITTAFWPTTPQNPIAVNAVAQNATRPSAAEALIEQVFAAQNREKSHIMSFHAAEEKIRGILDKPTEVNFQETTLEDAINYLKDFHSINIWIDKATLTDEGVSLDQTVTLGLAGVSFRSTLKLLLQPLQLTYIIEDEVMKVTTVSKAGHVIGVYDIRDLVGDFANQAGGAAAAPGAAPAMMAMMGVAAGSAPQGAPRHAHETTSFAELVARTIAPKTWTEAGGDGLVIQYGGSLVVRNGQTVHDDVRNFIKLMRLARNDALGQ